MTTKHTPGPWTMALDGGWIDGPGDTTVVEYAGCGSHEAEWSNPADKALVLAAPALLEALKLLLEDSDPRDLNAGSPWCDARAAIALATLDTNE